MSKRKKSEAIPSLYTESEVQAARDKHTERLAAQNNDPWNTDYQAWCAQNAKPTKTMMPRSSNGKLKNA